MAQQETPARLGPYEIEAEIGSGGMGHVYRARDGRLGRIVAVKILAPAAAGDGALRKRFLREAKAISALNHPNICALYDIGSDDGRDFLVMEYLEGETLAQRLERGPLSAEEMLTYASEIASALEWAHRRGIIHRDLKPGNIMLTRSGAKLLDFGLARMSSADDPVSNTLSEDTMVGTMDYMAPEQLSGGAIDPRTDLFALGVVMYEILSGSRPFRGPNRASVMGSILFSNPRPLSEAGAGIPAAIERLISACLEKKPEDRIQSAHDLKLHLQWLREGREWHPRAGRHRWSVPRTARFLVAAAAAAALIGFALSAAWKGRSKPASLPPTLSALTIPGEYAIPPDAAPAVSPDGRRFAAVVMKDTTAIYVRALQDAAGRVLPDTTGAAWVAWAPDSRHVLFGTLGKIARADTISGSVTILGDAADPRGATQNQSGDVVYSPNYAGRPLMRIAAGERKAVAVTKLQAGETSHRWPQFLPDGKHFLFFAARKDSEDEFGRICIGALDSADVRCPIAASSQAIFAEPDILLCNTGGTVRAYHFDTKDLTVGRVIADLTDVDTFDNSAITLASASSNGMFIYMSKSTQRAKGILQWLDRSGRVLETVGKPAVFGTLELSHDGETLAVGQDDDIWTYNLRTGVASRITSGRSIEGNPVWSPDDRQIAYNESRAGHYETRIRPAAPVPAAGTHILDESQPEDWSNDGRFLVMAGGSSSQRRVFAYSFAGHRAMPLYDDRMDLGAVEISPDSGWIAFNSNVGGSDELYVDSFPAPSRRIQISNGGANYPRWSRDGKELFFVAPAGQLMSAPVSKDADRLTIGRPRELFKLEPLPGVSYPSYGVFDVSNDGQRFIFIRSREPERRPITLVTNWTATLDR